MGYICPVGHYCDPRFSVTEIQCPVGTYNPNTEGKYLTDCLDCPTGYYQSSAGQPACIECGTGATSSTGAVVCSCKGKFRWWKSEKNTCECKKGYTSNPDKYEIFTTSGEYESLDCAMQMCKPACGKNEFCNTDFICESKACTASCPNGDGSFNENLQMCECTNDPTSVTAACDSTCQSTAASFYYDSSTSKYCCDFKCAIATVNQVVCKTADELNMYTGGGIISGSLPSMSGSSGSYECPASILAFKPSCYTSIYSARRNLDSDDKRDLAALATTYDQTLICLTSSVNTVTWTVSSTTFPTYNKDHALNDDTDFDAASFDTLKYKLINGGVSLTSFTYSFSSITSKIALAFNDYTSSSKLTVVALYRDSCPDGNVLPLNSATLASVGISTASFLELHPMEDWLVIFPLFFCLLGVGFGALVKFLELRYEKARIAKLKKKREFIREDGSVDRIQYLKDLYKVIKQYLDNLDDDDPIKAIIDSENNEVELSQQSESADEIKKLMEKFFDDLRFADGELVEDRVLAESTDPSEESKASGEETEEEYNEDGSEEEFLIDDGEGEDDSQDNDPLDLNELLGPQEDAIEEQDEDSEDDKDHEAILAIKRENERKRREYEDSLKKLGLSDEERRELLEKYEDSLRRAREMMEGDADSQEKRRLQKLEERRNRKQEGRLKLKELEDKGRDISKDYKTKIEKFDDAIEEKVSHINDEVQKEEDEERQALEQKLKDRLKKFKDQFYQNIKGKSGNIQKKIIADHERENERLQKDLERERAHQEKKLLKNREARRKRLIDGATKELNDLKNDVLRDQADELEDIERQKLLVAAEYGLEDELFDKNISKVNDEEEKRKSNQIKEIELLRLKQKQRFEKEFEDLIQDIIPEEQENFENMHNEINEERANFKQRIAGCDNEAEKQRLLQELEDKEQDWAEDLERQRQLQDQQLFEKKKRRGLFNLRNKFKLESKHRDEGLEKTLELMEFEAFKRETEALERVDNTLDKEKGEKDLPLHIYKMLEDMINRRLDDQAKIQFYELSGRLCNLYTDIAFEKALARKNLEEDMNDKVKELDSRNVPSQEFQKEIAAFQKELDNKGRDQEQDLIRRQMEKEMDLREKLKEKNYDDKKKLEEDLFAKKQEVLQKLAKDFRNEGILKLLLARSREELDERLLKIAEDKENDIQKIKLQLVAKNKKDLAQMEKRLEEDLAKEKRQEEINFEKKKKKMLKDLKSKYLEGLKSRENLTKDQKDMLLKKHEEEISRFELALAKEKERQYRRMREKLILKRLEAEKEKEHKRREARINRQMRDDVDEEDMGRRKRGKKGRGKHAQLLKQLTDVIVERSESQYDKTSNIPRRHGINMNVQLRGFKDSIMARQEKEGNFDPNLYLKYKGHDDDDDYIDFKRLQTEDVSLKSGVTDARGKPETTRLLRRIIRVEKISKKISEEKSQQLIDDLNKISEAMKNRRK